MRKVYPDCAVKTFEHKLSPESELCLYELHEQEPKEKKTPYQMNFDYSKPTISRSYLSEKGTGNPFFTTDTASVLRAVELDADVMLKGTRVDGIYTADPEKDPNATKFDEISYDEIYNMGLKIMDLTATTLAKDNDLPIIVFDMDTIGNLKKVLSGQNIGTLVHN